MAASETPAIAPTAVPAASASPIRAPRRRRRWTGALAYIVALGVTIGAIALTTLTLRYDSPAARFILDYGKESIFPYPYTIQNFMYLVMALAFAQLWLRWRAAEHEHALIDAGLLPEDGQTVLEFSDPRLGAIRRQVADKFDDRRGYLPFLIDVSVSQLLSSRSVDQVLAVFNSAVEIVSHRVDLNYQLLRYLVWLIPTIGFIGTVVGIAYALEDINPVAPELKKMTDRLGISFYTTIVALFQSMVIYFLQNMVQQREEHAVNRAASYCLRNLINRLYFHEPHSLSK